MPHDPPPAVGIDLGTTFSVVAHLDQAGRPWTIPNSEGDLTTPSVVLFDAGGVTVGKEAVRSAPLEPGRVAEFAKRDMGSPLYSRPVAGEFLPPEVVQSLVLEKLKRDAEARVGPFTKCVVTVPAFFNEPRRKATQDAGQLAGLDVIDILNEPTAAAIAYGVQAGFLTGKGESRQAERVLVFDLGGGTFDVTLMSIEGSHYAALATGGDVQLGGIDWDRRVADHLAAAFLAAHRGTDPRTNPSGLCRLLRDAEEAKRGLSAREQVSVTLEHAGQSLRVPLTRTQFAELTADLLERTRFTTLSVLRDAGVGWAGVTRLLLVGGSTRMPAVADMLERESGMKVDRSLSADESVAHGAAIYAGLLLSAGTGRGRVATVRNVNSHDLGVLGREPQTGRQRVSVLIPRNSPLPATCTKRFRTGRTGQDSVVIAVVEGGDASGNNATKIGQCVIAGLPPGLPAGTPVEVTFAYQANGRLSVRGLLPGHSLEAELAVERAAGLTDATLHDWGRRLKGGQGPLTV